jgi:NADH-quinone oxidoreductase subunit E
MVRLREDRVRELETEVAQQRARVSALEQQLAGVHAVRTADDLKRISGIGPGFERALHAIGVTSFRQIAEWTPADLERVAREIRTTPRRITRDQWVERARELADAEAQASPSEA